MPSIGFTLLWNVGLATVLAILVGLLSRSKILRQRPRLVHALWLLVLAKLITPPLISLPVFPGLKAEKVVEGSQLRSFDSNFVGSELSPIGQERTEGDLVARSQPATTDQRMASHDSFMNLLWSIPWSAIFVGISGFGTCILITASFSQLWRLSRVLRRAASGDVRLHGLSQSAASRMGMQGVPVVCAVDASITPLLWVRPTGPVIVMPTSLAERMSDEQITCIFCHELAHYVRRDHWSNAFAFLVAALFWWHPVAWWARREMRDAQEECCDGLALATGAATRRCYAETLFQTLEFVQTNRSFHPSLVSGFGGSSSLQRRFEMIASQNVIRRFSRWATAFLVVGFAAILCFPVPGRSQTAADDADKAKQEFDEARPNDKAKKPVEKRYPTAQGWTVEKQGWTVEKRYPAKPSTAKGEKRYPTAQGRTVHKRYPAKLEGAILKKLEELRLQEGQDSDDSDASARDKALLNRLEELRLQEGQHSDDSDASARATIIKASGEELLAAPTKSPWVKVPGEKILGWTKEPTGKKTIGWTKVPIKGKTVIEKRYPTAQGWTVRKRYPAKPSTGKAPGTSLMKSPRHHTDRTGLDRSE